MSSDITDDSQLEEELLDLVAEEGMVDREKLQRDALMSDLDIASADFIMILMAIEEKYGVYISVDNEMTDLKTIQDLLTAAARKIREQQPE